MKYFGFGIGKETLCLAPGFLRSRSYLVDSDAEKHIDKCLVLSYFGLIA